jgi:tetratricopeptide (TPR) repeat protein
VLEAVAARFERMPDAARHVAEIAALAGTHFSREILCDVAGWNAAEVFDALETLIERRFIRERFGRGPFNLSFSHDLVRQAILGIAPGSPDRHRRVARVIEKCHPELANELALELASHYERAGAPNEAARRFARAARRALELGAVDDAETALARGLALEIDARTRAELLLISVEVGERGDVAEQFARIDRLDALAIELGDDELRDTALSARAELHLDFGEELRLAEEANEIRRRALERGLPRWLAFADLVEALLSLESRNSMAAVEPLERALATFRESGDHVGAARCIYALTQIALRRGDLAAARPLFDELARTAEQSGEYRTKLRATIAALRAVNDFGYGQDGSELTRRWLALAIEAGDRREESRALGQHTRSLPSRVARAPRSRVSSVPLQSRGRSGWTAGRPSISSTERRSRRNSAPSAKRSRSSKASSARSKPR